MSYDDPGAGFTAVYYDRSKHARDAAKEVTESLAKYYREECPEDAEGEVPGWVNLPTLERVKLARRVDLLAYLNGLCYESLGDDHERGWLCFPSDPE